MIEMNEELETLRVFSTPNTTEMTHSLRAQLSSLESAVRGKIKALDKEVALSKLGSLPSSLAVFVRSSSFQRCE
jgi:hypothetical protein